MSLNLEEDLPVTVRYALHGPGSARSPVSSHERVEYSARITYREPSYARYTGHARLYSYGMKVRAASEREAIARARAQFEAIESHIGWVRVIEDVVVALVS